MQGETPQTSSSWTYRPDAMSQSEGEMPNKTQTAPEPTVSWTASEYVAHHKNAGWFLLLSLAAVGAAALVYLVTEDMVSTGGVVFAALALGIFGARQPRVLEYKLTERGLMIAQKFYPYGGFKSFAVMEEGAIRNVMLLPLQRFMPPINIYYDPEDETKILQTLSQHLPLENRKQDMVDRFMHKIRF